MKRAKKSPPDYSDGLRCPKCGNPVEPHVAPSRACAIICHPCGLTSYALQSKALAIEAWRGGRVVVAKTGKYWQPAPSAETGEGE